MVNNTDMMNHETPTDNAPLKADDLNPRAALGLLTRAEAAAVLGKAEETLRQWAVRRKGLSQVKLKMISVPGPRIILSPRTT